MTTPVLLFLTAKDELVQFFVNGNYIISSIENLLMMVSVHFTVGCITVESRGDCDSQELANIWEWKNRGHSKYL